MEILKLEKNKTTNVKFVPNIHNPNEPVHVLPICAKDSGVFVEKYFSFVYDLNDSKIKCFIFGSTIFDVLKNFTKNKCYYNDNKKILHDKWFNRKPHAYSILPDFQVQMYDKKQIKDIDKDTELFYDINKIDNPVMINDLTLPYYLSISCSDMQGFLNINNINMVDMEPLFDGTDKQKVLDLYKDIPDIKQYVQLYIDQNIKDCYFYEDAYNNRKR
jgi:hypothetical protein